MKLFKALFSLIAFGPMMTSEAMSRSLLRAGRMFFQRSSRIVKPISKQTILQKFPASIYASRRSHRQFFTCNQSYNAPYGLLAALQQSFYDRQKQEAIKLPYAALGALVLGGAVQGLNNNDNRFFQLDTGDVHDAWFKTYYNSNFTNEEKESSFYRAVYTERYFHGSDLIGIENKFQLRDVAVLEKIQKHDPAVFIQLQAHAFSLFKARRASYLVPELIKMSPHFADEVVNHFEVLIKDEPGRIFLEELIKRSPDIASRFVDKVGDHFDVLMTEWSGWSFLREFIKSCPRDVSPVIDKAVEHFDTLIESNLGRCILKELIKSGPQNASRFVGKVMEHFEALIESYETQILLEELIKSGSQNALQVIDKVVDSFEVSIKNYQYRRLLVKLIKIYGDIPDRLIDKVIIHLDVLIKGIEGLLFLDELELIKRCPAIASRFADKAVEHFKKLVKTTLGRSLITELIKSSPQNASRVIDKAFDDPYLVVKQNWGPSILEELNESSPENTSRFIDKVVEHFEALVKDEMGQKLLYKFASITIEHDKRIQEKIVDYLQNKASTLDIKDNVYMVISAPCHSSVKKLIHEQCKDTNDELKFLVHEFFRARCLNKRGQSLNHIKRNVDKIIATDFSVGISDDPLVTIFDKEILQRSRQLEKQGYVSFFHGQRLGYILVEEWFTKLHELVSGEPAGKHLMLHVKPLPKTKQEVEAHSNERIKLLANQRGYYQGQKLLFLNYALFANTSNLGSSSRTYALGNTNCGPQNVIMEDAFIYTGLQDIYQKFEKELVQLECEHNALSKYGAMLLLAIPEEQLSDCVYTSCSLLSQGSRSSINIDGIGETDDIRLIMKTLKEHPEKIKDTDQIEFCLIMTADENGGLNPKSGIQVHPFRIVEDEKLAAFRQKEALLWEKIKADVLASINKNGY